VTGYDTLPVGATFVRKNADGREVWETPRAVLLVEVYGRATDPDGGRYVLATKDRPWRQL